MQFGNTKTRQGAQSIEIGVWKFEYNFKKDFATFWHGHSNKDGTIFAAFTFAHCILQCNIFDIGSRTQVDTIIKLNTYFVVRWLAKIIKGLSSKSEGCEFNSHV